MVNEALVTQALASNVLAPGMLPQGLRIYAIGDVHGCADQLAALHAQIAQDARAHPAEEVVLVHLGDYVDRGDDSAGVLERLLGPCPVPGGEVVNLLGNHEVMMLDACDPRSPAGAMPFWLENGGAETLASYRTGPEDPAPWEAIPREHLALLRGCSLRWAAGDYLFVHAGLRPGVELDAQSDNDLCWIRDEFLSHRDSFGPMVVHGHSITEDIDLRANRIGIDTGAFASGKLTAIGLEGGERWFLST